MLSPLSATWSLEHVVQPSPETGLVWTIKKGMSPPRLPAGKVFFVAPGAKAPSFARRGNILRRAGSEHRGAVIPSLTRAMDLQCSFSPDLDRSVHPQILVGGTEVGVGACRWEGKRHRVPAGHALDRIVWTSRSAAGARCRARREGMSSEAASKGHLLSGGDRQAIGTVSIADGGSTKTDGPRGAGAGRVGEVGAAVDRRRRVRCVATSARNKDRNRGG